MIEVSELYLLVQNKKKLDINPKLKTIYFTFPNYRRFYQYNQLYSSPNGLNQRLYEIFKGQKDTDHILIAYIASTECNYINNAGFMSMMSRFFSQGEIYSFAQPGYENTRMVRKYSAFDGLLQNRVVSSELFLRCHAPFSDIGRISISYITNSIYRATSDGIPPLNSLIISLKASIMRTGDDLLYNQVNKIYFIFQCDERGIKFLEESLHQVDGFYRQLKTEIRIYKKIRDKQSVANLFYLKFLTKIPMRSIVNTLRHQKCLFTYSLPIMQAIKKLLVLDLWHKVYQDRQAQKKLKDEQKLENQLSSPDLLASVNSISGNETKKHRKRRKQKENSENTQQTPLSLHKSQTIVLTPKQLTLAQEDSSDLLVKAPGLTSNQSFAPGYVLQRDQLKQPQRLIHADYVKILSSRVIRRMKTEFVLKTTKSYVFQELEATPLQNSLIKSVRNVQRGTRAYIFSLDEPGQLGPERDFRGPIQDLPEREKALQRLKEKYGEDKHAQVLLRELRGMLYAQVEPPYPVFLNVYNLMKGNFMIKIGLGVYHTAIQVLGMEFAYGGHDYNETGVYSIKPKSLGGASFIKSVYLGHSWLSLEEIADIILQASTKWIGRDYDLLRHNCNHFTGALSLALCGSDVPVYINRAARIGKLFVRGKSIENKLADTVGFQGEVDVTESVDSKQIIPNVEGSKNLRVMEESHMHPKHEKHLHKHHGERGDRIEAEDEEKPQKIEARRGRVI